MDEPCVLSVGSQDFVSWHLIGTVHALERMIHVHDQKHANTKQRGNFFHFNRSLCCIIALKGLGLWQGVTKDSYISECWIFLFMKNHDIMISRYLVVILILILWQKKHARISVFCSTINQMTNWLITPQKYALTCSFLFTATHNFSSRAGDGS